MKVSTERQIIRWVHIILSIPVIGYIYGPVAHLPHAASAVRVGILPGYRHQRFLALERPLV